MTIFLILAPYGTLAALSLVASATVSLFWAALICLAVIAIDVARGRTMKILTVGSVTVFTAIGCYLTFADPSLSNTAANFAVDIGMLSVSLLSIVFRHPFTLQYAREMVDAQTMQYPGFVHTNYLLTWAWTGAFLLMAIGNIAVLYVPGLPLWSGLLIAFAARNSAIVFTKWYPEYRKARYGAPPANALPSP